MTPSSYCTCAIPKKKFPHSTFCSKGYGGCGLPIKPVSSEEKFGVERLNNAFNTEPFDPSPPQNVGESVEVFEVHSKTQHKCTECETHKELRPSSVHYIEDPHCVLHGPTPRVEKVSEINSRKPIEKVLEIVDHEVGGALRRLGGATPETKE